MFPVSLEKEKALRKKLNSLRIYEKDIEESFIRSQGRGGQKVNKSSTCVYLKHIPICTTASLCQNRPHNQGEKE
jgi:protein subunit release factor B